MAQSRASLEGSSWVRQWVAKVFRKCTSHAPVRRRGAGALRQIGRSSTDKTGRRAAKKCSSPTVAGEAT
ncbi:unnamed protein product [Protopolystoma xenopodis]|uniref:Uncharacterized protein n=1 Tax=Protopolystoma xenopodis TaxID=117903 RepID=A0A448XJD6_9PLAT|nr:unnamed protein product [Protopolystoma xenopodis]